MTKIFYKKNFVFQDEDGIIVRVVKSRPRDRGDRTKRNSESSSKPTSSDVKPNKPESNRDEKRRLEREQRDNKRKEERQRFREERDQKRQAERERNRKERESNKKEEAKTEKSSAKMETDAPHKGNPKEDRVKRYSESRRARMESKDQSDVGNRTVGTADKPGSANKVEKFKAESEKCDESKDKDVQKEKAESVQPANDKCYAAEDARNNDHNDDSSGDNAKGSSSKSLTKEERLARRIRNKV